MDEMQRIQAQKGETGPHRATASDTPNRNWTTPGCHAKLCETIRNQARQDTVISHLVIGHSCSIVPVKNSWCVFHSTLCNGTNTPSSRSSQIRTQRTLRTSHCVKRCTTPLCNQFLMCLRKCTTRTFVVSLALLPEQHAPHIDQD